MKKCKKCGALQSDDRSVCLDCGTLLGRPMTEAEEAAAEAVLDEKLSDMAERTEDFYVPLRDKIMGILCILGVVTGFLLVWCAGGAADSIKDILPDDPIIITGYYTTENGYTTVYPEGAEAYSHYYRRLDALEYATLGGIVAIVTLILAFPMLLFPRLMWRMATLKYRIFYEWDTTPSDFALLMRKGITYILFGIGIIALLYGWVLYL